jgi:uncharacterized protein (DUF1501 family)
MVGAMLTARTLLEHNLGVECVFIPQPGSYDTHVGQRGTGQPHETQLGQLDAGIEAFYFGTVGGQPLSPAVGPIDSAVANLTLILTISEFGRRIGENAGDAIAGTDHGAAAPTFLIGPPTPSTTVPNLVPGLHSDHPDLGTPILPADNLMLTTDLRALYQAILENWLGDHDNLFPVALPGLFK